MTTQFEFRLKESNAPEGELDADDLIALVQSLKAVAMSIGRSETDADRLGRAPSRVHRVANLVIGLAPGSTRLLVRRAGAGVDALDFDLADEEGFDSKFERLVESIGLDHRPDWVSDSLSNAAGELASALRRAAPEVEFKADGLTVQTFYTAALRPETWEVAAGVSTEFLTFIGRLYSANLHTHRFQVEDDAGNQVALPDVADDSGLGPLLGRYVTVTGTPEAGADGQLKRLLNSRIVALLDGVAEMGVRDSIPLGDILAAAPGIEPGGIDGVSDDEADAFFAAIGL
ncbi:hypothetical protein [Rhodococcus sp. IEGM 1330]|uniref:hypothetical protein n=1 Tax=Rhodococcus sp. IEGM 1330 TaxID=3082225 RepID=UPI002952C826|nr:hypothetical protein [Rhodococcus sp. IEGM 1330]MDV8021645.1 hypothetical protein [Rhodococcus sp. IEGM 1330]